MFIDSETLKEVNIYAKYKDRSRLDTPEIRAAVGVIEIADPQPPADAVANPDNYIVSPTGDGLPPYRVWVKKSDEQIRQQELAKMPVLTPWQMRKALRAAGLMPTIKAAIASAPEELQEAWEFASEFRRDNELVESFRVALGKTEQDIDALFKLGATL